MSIADEARAEAFNRLIGVEARPVTYESLFDVGWNAHAEWQASRKPEAAPSDTERDYLLLLVRQTLSANRHEARPTVARAIVRELIAEGFSRTSQPVQVEVTDAMVEKAAEALWRDAADGQYRWRKWEFLPERIKVRFMDHARAVLAAALGGGTND